MDKIYEFFGLLKVLVVLLVVFFKALIWGPEQTFHESAPFALDKGGELVELEMRIPEERLYTFGLEFFVNQKSHGDVDRLIKLMGESAKNPRTGEYYDLGVPLSVILQVRSIDQHRPVFNFDKTISEIAVYGGGFGSYEKKITDLKLEPGLYSVRLENMRSAPDLSGRTIKFYIVFAHRGK